MGREVRRVRPDWVPPISRYGEYLGLFDGMKFNIHVAEWDEGKVQWGLGLMKKYDSSGEFMTYSYIPKDKTALDCEDYEDWEGPRPEPEYYTPIWTQEEATHYMMFETTTEGTPISPAFATPEEVARWLADNDTYDNATYEQWLAVAKGGYAPTFVYTPATGVISGVSGIAVLEKAQEGNGGRDEQKT